MSDNKMSLFEKWQEVSIELFPDANETSSTHHAVAEITEIWFEHDYDKKVVEYVDVFMCLLSAMKQAGIPFNQFMAAFKKKFAKNINRKWNKNADGSYSHDKTFSQ